MRKYNWGELSRLFQNSVTQFLPCCGNCDPSAITAQGQRPDIAVLLFGGSAGACRAELVQWREQAIERRAIVACDRKNFTVMLSAS